MKAREIAESLHAVPITLWDEETSNIEYTAAFATALALTSLLRHNAPLFTVTLLLAVAFHIGLKRLISVCLCAVALVVGIKLPLYSALDVAPADRSAVETLGLPMTVIGSAITYSPETLDADILEFAYRAAPKELWEENYLPGNFNAVKWDSRFDSSAIDEYGARRVLEMADRLADRDVIVLAQASMAHMEGPVATHTGLPTLSSVDRCVAQVRAILEGAK